MFELIFAGTTPLMWSRAPTVLTSTHTNIKQPLRSPTLHPPLPHFTPFSLQLTAFPRAPSLNNLTTPRASHGMQYQASALPTTRGLLLCLSILKQYGHRYPCSKIILGEFILHCFFYILLPLKVDFDFMLVMFTELILLLLWGIKTGVLSWLTGWKSPQPHQSVWQRVWCYCYWCQWGYC